MEDCLKQLLQAYKFAALAIGLHCVKEDIRIVLGKRSLKKCSTICSQAGNLPDTFSQSFCRFKHSIITIDYSDGGAHYDMAVASLLHAVQLYRVQNKRPVEKVQEFVQWMYDYLLVSEYMLTYIIMLFTGQENIKAPKHAKSEDIRKIIHGCKNQAWDISYLTKWSTLYADAEKYRMEFLFATNDILLKRIFINCNTEYGVNGLLYNVFPQKEYNQLIDYIESRTRNRVKPDFGDDPRAYFLELIEKEKRELQILLESENICQ